MKFDAHTLGQWYLRKDTQEMFQVIEDDEQSGTIRIQLFDGSLDEIEPEAWRAISPVPVSPPEDWTGPLDLELADYEGWTDEERDSPIDVFSDDREPWEDIVLQELSELDYAEDEAAWVSRSMNAGPTLGAERTVAAPLTPAPSAA